MKKMMSIEKVVAVVCMTGGLMTLDNAAYAEVLSNQVDGITIDADRSDWTGLTRYADDTQEGYPIDLGFVTMAHDADNLYVRYQMYFPSNAFNGQYRLLIDSDQNLSTGYTGTGGVYAASVGANFYIEGASIFAHTAANQDGFGFDYLGAASFNSSGGESDDIELAIPLALLGNPDSIDFLVWVNSNGNFDLDGETAGGDDSFPNGVFNSVTKASATYTLVPEPASFALLGLGATSMLARRRQA